MLKKLYGMSLRPIVLLLLSWATASLLAVECQVRFRRNHCSVSRVSSRVAAAFQVALPMQRLETAQTTFPLPLTVNTATKEDGDNPTLSPVMVTLIYPTSGINPDLPWVMMFNGANCYGQDYHYLMNQLASKGYLAVVTTEQHPSDKDLPDVAPSCPKGVLVSTTASMLNDVHHVLSSLTSNPEDAIQSINANAKAALVALNTESIVLMSHSLGSLTAINMLTGRCEQDDQPCGNYTAILDKNGNNALRGAFAFEGQTGSETIVPDGRFLTYISGQYAPSPEEAYNKTKGKCVHYVQLKAGNHYAIVDWNPDTAPHQKAQCAIQLPHDDPNFTTTKEEQEERISFIATLANAMTRAQVLHDSRAAEFVLHEVPHHPLLKKAHLAELCFESPAIAQS